MTKHDHALLHRFMTATELCDVTSCTVQHFVTVPLCNNNNNNNNNILLPNLAEN